MADFLLREFCNHIYLGQWELARACAISLNKSSRYAQEENIIKEFLSTVQNVAENPYLVRASWAVAPCPSFISFWASLILHDLDYVEIASKLREQADFNIMLETFFRNSKYVIQELACVHHNLKEADHGASHSFAPENSKLSDKCLTLIKNAFKENPSAISVMLNMLRTKDCCLGGVSLNSVIWDIHYQHILNCLKSLRSMKEKANKPQNLKDSSSKIYLLLSLIPEVELEGYNLECVADIFSNVLELCELNILDRRKIYQSLLKRTSPALCKYFCSFEGKVENSSETSDLNLPCFHLSSHDFCHRTAFLHSITSSKHFLQDLIEFCINKLLQGNWKECLNIIKDSLFSRLSPLPLILSWESSRDDLSAMNIIDAIKMWNEPICDSVLDQVFKAFKKNIVFTDLCQTYYQQMHPHASNAEIQNKIRNILCNLQLKSPLKVVHTAFGLKNLSHDGVLQLLNINQEDAVNKNSLYLTDKAIYSGYLAINYVIEAIHLSCEYKEIISRRKKYFVDMAPTYDCLNSDKPCRSERSMLSLEESLNHHNPSCAYAMFISDKLTQTRNEIKKIFPVAYRVEILENIFSLLFSMSDILVDSMDRCSDSDQGHEGDNSVSVIHCENVLSTNSSSQSIESAEKISSKFIISTAKLKDQQEYSQNFHSKSTESNSSPGVHPYTFLCNELITRDLLFLLKDCALEANAESYKVIAQSDSFPVKGLLETSDSDFKNSLSLSISNSELPERISKLLQYINEAIWRYEVVKSEIFHERGSFFSFQKKKHLFCSQTSASSSDGTDKESRKHRKKRKHKRSFTNIKKESFAESSIIQCMLSSPEALLRYSLWSRNLEQAEQIIGSFYLGDSNEAKEVVLTRELQRISKKLVENEKIKRKTFMKRKASIIEGKSILSNLQAIEDAAAVGLQSSEIGLIIHQELSTLRIPEVIDITDGIRHPELMLGSENIYSIFLSDLGYVSSSSLDLTSILFDMACRSWSNPKESIQELDAKVLSKKKMPLIRGNFRTLGMMNAIVKEFLSLQEGQEELKFVFWPLGQFSGSFSRVLSNFLGNLDSKIFKTELINWKQVSLLLHDFIVMMKDEEVKEKSGIIQKDITHENRLHITYKKLSKILRELRSWSSETIRSQPAKYDNYLSKLLIHLHQVTTAVLDCKKQNSNEDSVIYTSDFSILKESPVELLKKIILQSGVTPDKIEKFAIRMKVDLVHVLAQACLPHVALLNKSASSDILLQSSCFLNENGYPMLILNKESKNSMSSQHPDFVARKLLQDLISMIQG